MTPKRPGGMAGPFFFTYFAINLPSAHKIVGTMIINSLEENLMDHINRIELQGRVGTVRTNIVGETRVANFSLVTEHLYKTRDGGAVNETTWHYVVAWDGKDMPDLDLIQKGTAVNVTGRLRASRYTAADGTEKQMFEVVAGRVRLLSDEEIGRD